MRIALLSSLVTIALSLPLATGCNKTASNAAPATPTPTAPSAVAPSPSAAPAQAVPTPAPSGAVPQAATPQNDTGSATHAAAKETPARAAVQEMAAYRAARPVFEAHCAKCHTTKGKKARKKSLAHFNMDSYPFTGKHAATIGIEIRKVLGATGKKVTMPKDDPGSVKGAELHAILTWANAWKAAHPGASAAPDKDDD